MPETILSSSCPLRKPFWQGKPGHTLEFTPSHPANGLSLADHHLQTSNHRTSTFLGFRGWKKGHTSLSKPHRTISGKAPGTRFQCKSLRTRLPERYIILTTLPGSWGGTGYKISILFIHHPGRTCSFRMTSQWMCTSGMRVRRTGLKLRGITESNDITMLIVLPSS